MIIDRGGMKWQGMMLTEHVNILKEWEKEVEMVKRPNLDDWELDLIQEEIEIALRSRCQTHFKMWVDGNIIERQGTIEEIDFKSRIIKVQDPFGILRIDVSVIVSVNRLD